VVALFPRMQRMQAPARKNRATTRVAPTAGMLEGRREAIDWLDEPK
jgi:hypothetical protein